MKERPILFSAPMVRAILDGRKTQTRRVVKPQPDHLQFHEHNGRVIYDGESRMWCWKDLVLDNIWDFPDGADRATLASRCPYGVPGDRLWGRETWAPYHGTDEPVRELEDADCVRYAADGAVHMGMPDGMDHEPLDTYSLAPHVSMPGGPWRWRTSIHMPRWASRITLDVTEVRVQRLREISEEDALAEGVDREELFINGHSEGMRYRNYLAGEDVAEWFSSPVRSFFSLWGSINGAGSWDANPWVWAVSFKRVTP